MSDAADLNAPPERIHAGQLELIDERHPELRLVAEPSRRGVDERTGRDRVVRIIQAAVLDHGAVVRPPAGQTSFAKPRLGAQLDAVVGLRPGVIDGVGVEDVDQPLLRAIQVVHGERLATEGARDRHRRVVARRLQEVVLLLQPMEAAPVVADAAQKCRSSTGAARCRCIRCCTPV